jgi:5-oxoprolinase (ATP-hydrolysing)
MTASIVSSHRKVETYGMAGGEPGKTGQNLVQRADGKLIELKGCDQIEMKNDDIFIIKTPGGGGYGFPRKF